MGEKTIILGRDALLNAVRLSQALVSEIAALKHEVEVARSLAKEPDRVQLDEKLSDGTLPGLVVSALWYRDVRYVGDLVGYSPAEVKEFGGLGKAGYEAITWFLGRRGLYLGMDRKGWVRPPDAEAPTG